MTSQSNHSGHGTTDETSQLHILYGSADKVWPTAEHEVIITSNEERCPKPIDKEKKARHRAAIAILETMEGIRDELGESYAFLLKQSCPDYDGKYILQVYKYYLRLSNFLQDRADDFLAYEETNTGPVAVDADIKGLEAECDFAKVMSKTTVLIVRYFMMQNECEASKTVL